MKVFGLTGGTGSGKSVVAQILKEKNAFIIDADKIGHEIILKGTPAYYEIIKYFGEDILDENKNIIRKKLGKIVFSDKEKLDFLNKCTRNHIVDEIIHQVDIAKKTNSSCIVIDAALLTESGLGNICDDIIVVTAKKDVRLDRISKRDGITIDEAKMRMTNQKSDEQYVKDATIIIDNSSDIDHLKKQIDLINFN